MKNHPYRLLGKTGLRVSRLCLGGMTFGTEWGFGCDAAQSNALMDLFVENGGNFIDTADLYNKGSSEAIIGAWMKERKNRDAIVLGSKFSFGARKSNPNSGGNGRKNMIQALEGSLRRLQVDFIAVYWMHAWDGVTPAEEVMRTADDLVRAGKIRAFALSDVPAWYAARALTIAEWRGTEAPCALHLEYSLVGRNLEREHSVFAQLYGVSLMPWSPLAAGFLTGKWTKEPQKDLTGRLQAKGENPVYARYFNEQNWSVLESLKEIARNKEVPPAAVALAWVCAQPAVTSVITGARTVEQLQQNLAALDVAFTPDELDALNAVSKPAVIHPYNFFQANAQNGMTGGVTLCKHWR